MEQAILLLHLFLVVFLIALVLLQRSEGGALGMGGGGGGVVTGRGAATALQKVTWYLAAGFLATSLTLTVIAQSGRSGSSVMEGVETSTEIPADGSNTGDVGGILDGLATPTIGNDSGAATPPATPSTPAAAEGDGPSAPPAE